MIHRSILPVVVLFSLTIGQAIAQPAAQDLDTAQEKAYLAAVQRVAPCVVRIDTSGGTDVISSGGRGPQVRKGEGSTTGLLVSADGLVITSAFNFANKPTGINVLVPGKKPYVAKVLATDQSRMLTLLQLLAVDAKDLPLPVPAASPKSEIKIGHTAIALGRTLDPILDHSPSVSVGIISAVGRIWGKALQTDAKVSPANYGGPLVDVLGRVQGVLVPASPRAEGETAGVEWYDSGIGFAIPLEDVMASLPRLKQGKDLQRGVLGVNLQLQDIYGQTAVVQGVAPDSPASKAGIKVGDEVVEMDGKPVTRLSQFMHHLGTKYEGETVSLKVKRKEDDKFVVKDFPNLRLVAPLVNYSRPFIGFLPMRDDPELGVEVRYVYPKSPADAAGMAAGDRIMKVGNAQIPPQPFQGSEHLALMLGSFQAGSDIKVEVKRKTTGKTDTLTVRLGEAPNAVPLKLPENATLKKALEPRKTVGPMGPGPMGQRGPGRPKQEPKKEEKKDDKKDDKKDAKKAETGFFKRSNAAQDHQYWMLVPEDYDPNISYALLIWLHPVGKSKDKDFEDFKDTWEDYCQEKHMIIAAPKAENDSGWLGSEAEFVQEVANEVIGQYTIDRRRVVMHGMGVGGQLAFRLGFRARELVRGVATTGSVMADAPKDTASNDSLAFFIVAGEKDPIAKAIADSKDKLLERKFPVVFHEIPNMGHQYLDVETLDELVRWIDSLDNL